VPAFLFSAAASGDVEVAPGPGLILWTAWLLAVLPAAIVLIAKDRRGWFLAGLLTGGLVMIPAALLVPGRPASLWVRRVRRVRRD
jgi:hypothetical protein